jgi:hypothetical protein
MRNDGAITLVNAVNFWGSRADQIVNAVLPHSGYPNTGWKTDDLPVALFTYYQRPNWVSKNLIAIAAVVL